MLLLLGAVDRQFVDQARAVRLNNSSCQVYMALRPGEAIDSRLGVAARRVRLVEAAGPEPAARLTLTSAGDRQEVLDRLRVGGARLEEALVVRAFEVDEGLLGRAAGRETAIQAAERGMGLLGVIGKYGMYRLTNSLAATARLALDAAAASAVISFNRKPRRALHAPLAHASGLRLNEVCLFAILLLAVVTGSNTLAQERSAVHGYETAARYVLNHSRDSKFCLFDGWLDGNFTSCFRKGNFQAFIYMRKLAAHLLFEGLDMEIGGFQVPFNDFDVSEGLVNLGFDLI
ncbi:MAG: hypothetical protein HC784_12460 [Hydrococcus sp. CSU_1_8]|nr:hypothetical protein [Hydrococcus sp. CSU_1_8]